VIEIQAFWKTLTAYVMFRTIFYPVRKLLSFNLYLCARHVPGVN